MAERDTSKAGDPDRAHAGSAEETPFDEVIEGKGGTLERFLDEKEQRSAAQSDVLHAPEDLVYVPGEHDEFIDPRLKDYPVGMVAKTVHLHNNPDEPILTFRFCFLSTFWVTVGCALSTFYYFKPFQQSISSYVIQLLSWATGDLMGRYLPKRQFSMFGGRFKWSMNPSPWNAKEHALVVVAYWGSCHTAYGLGPLSALEMYYGQKIGAGWAISFLVTTQLIGYGFAGLFRDVLVRPPKFYYPGVLPNIALFNAMHRDPSVTRKSLTFFAYCATAAFVWQWFPQLIFPMLSTLPLLCWFGHGNPVAYVLGSGNYGFGILDFSLDWNYINGTLQSMYTPLFASMNMYAGICFAVWILYPILYYTNTLDAKSYGAMTSATFDSDGNKYNVSRVLNADYTLNHTAMNEYSKPHWGASYVFYFFWGFTMSTGACFWAILWYGRRLWKVFLHTFKGGAPIEDEYDDPYLKIMARYPRVPQWWYLLLLVVSAALSLGTIYGGNLQLPWWGFFIMLLVAWVFLYPGGILLAVSNQMIGMNFLSEVIAGSLFPGKPVAVLTSLTYCRQTLQQTLNLVIDYKFGFYMKIPEKEMFIGQVWGTLLGPFINYAVMRAIIDYVGIPTLTGEVHSVSWNAAQSRNFYSISILWGVIGPQSFFSQGSMYNWVCWGFVVGPAAVLATYLVQRWKPQWDMERLCNPVLIFYGITLFPIYPTTSILTSFIAVLIFMGYIYHYRPALWRKYHYLFAVGLDCGTQVMSTAMAFAISLPNVTFPAWWGNYPTFTDRCFPPNSKLPNAMQISSST